jgi:murein DD-endopeptidase MepM/ murein hydrolase activator NlpD
MSQFAKTVLGHSLWIAAAVCAAIVRLEAEPASLAEPSAKTPIGISARSRSIAPGEVVVLTLTVPARTDRVTVRAFEHDISAFAVEPRIWRAIVGIDLDVAPGAYTVAVDAGNGLKATYPLMVKQRLFPTRRLAVDPAFVNPPESESQRIQRDTERLDAVWHASAAERQWTAPFVRPVPQPANSRFGTRSVFNGEPRNPHSGADFPSPQGTPVHAPNAGRVVLADSLYFSGNTVVIDHGLGLFSLLAHLSVIEVHEGDRVSAGQIIGRVGATGRVTGPHLHWAVRANGARVDPVALLTVLGREGRDGREGRER